MLDTKRIINKIENHKKEIAKQRDALQEIFEDIETELDAFDRGIEYLDDAINAISEVV